MLAQCAGHAGNKAKTENKVPSQFKVFFQGTKHIQHYHEAYPEGRFTYSISSGEAPGLTLNGAPGRCTGEADQSS